MNLSCINDRQQRCRAETTRLKDLPETVFFDRLGRLCQTAITASALAMNRQSCLVFLHKVVHPIWVLTTVEIEHCVKKGSQVGRQGLTPKYVLQLQYECCVVPAGQWKL